MHTTSMSDQNLSMLSSVWDPHTWKNLDRLEFRITQPDTSPATSVRLPLSPRCCETLSGHRCVHWQSCLTLMYKIFNHLVDSDSSCHFSLV